jgi:hypothetical protein
MDDFLNLNSLSSWNWKLVVSFTSIEDDHHENDCLALRM